MKAPRNLFLRGFSLLRTRIPRDRIERMRRVAGMVLRPRDDPCRTRRSVSDRRAEGGADPGSHGHCERAPEHHADRRLQDAGAAGLGAGHAKQPQYPKHNRGHRWARSIDLSVNSALLYRLSYVSV